MTSIMAALLLAFAGCGGDNLSLCDGCKTPTPALTTTPAATTTPGTSASAPVATVAPTISPTP
jgi:hypothetical protein